MCAVTADSPKLVFTDFRILASFSAARFLLKGIEPLLPSAITCARAASKSFNCFLSISDEKEYSTAFTIIQSI